MSKGKDDGKEKVLGPASRLVLRRYDAHYGKKLNKRYRKRHKHGMSTGLKHGICGTVIFLVLVVALAGSLNMDKKTTPVRPAHTFWSAGSPKGLRGEYMTSIPVKGLLSREDYGKMMVRITNKRVYQQFVLLPKKNVGKLPGNGRILSKASDVNIEDYVMGHHKNELKLKPETTECYDQNFFGDAVDLSKVTWLLKVPFHDSPKAVKMSPVACQGLRIGHDTYKRVGKKRVKVALKKSGQNAYFMGL